MKKVILVVLSVLMLASVVVPASAAAVDNGSTIQPLWTNTSVVDCTMIYIDGVGYAESAVSGKFGTSSVQTDMYLYRWDNDLDDWVYVDELHEIAYKRIGGTSLAFDADVGDYMCAEYTFTVTKNGYAEVIERTVYETMTE